jgi:hypothetical protein
MGEPVKLWRCRSCNRVLRERGLEYARARHGAMVEAAAGPSAAFVREATWGAYLASLRRCRCGSKRSLEQVAGEALSGQLPLSLDSVVRAA